MGLLLFLLGYYLVAGIILSVLLWADKDIVHFGFWDAVQVTFFWLPIIFKQRKIWK